MGHYCPLYGTHYNFELDMVISGLKKNTLELYFLYCYLVCFPPTTN